MKSSVESVKTIAWNIYLFERAVVYIFQSNILLLPSNAPISFASQKGVDNRHIFSGVDAVFS